MVKIKIQLKDSLGDQLDGEDLSEQDFEWITILYLHFKDIGRPPIPLKDWQIRVNSTEFSEFCTKQARTALFFDGAAKGNPKISVVGPNQTKKLMCSRNKYDLLFLREY